MTCTGTCPIMAQNFRYSLLAQRKSQLIAEIIHFGLQAISFYELIPKTSRCPPVSALPPLTHFQLDTFVQTVSEIPTLRIL